MYPRFDPVASLRIWAVEATLGGRLLRIPPLPAADWLPVIMAGNVMQAKDLLEDFRLAECLLAGEFTVAQLRDVLTELIEEATGRTVVAAFAIAGAAAGRWDAIGADVARVGVRFDQISIAAGLDALYASVLRHMDEKTQAQFIRLLVDQKPRGSTVRVPRDAQPLPASAMQYVQTRPKTQLRRPQDPPTDPSEQPRPRLPVRTGSARPSRIGLRMPAGGGDESPPGA